MKHFEFVPFISPALPLNAFNTSVLLFLATFDRFYCCYQIHLTIPVFIDAKKFRLKISFSYETNIRMWYVIIVTHFSSHWSNTNSIIDEDHDSLLDRYWLIPKNESQSKSLIMDSDNKWTNQDHIKCQLSINLIIRHEYRRNTVTHFHIASIVK